MSNVSLSFFVHTVESSASFVDSNLATLLVTSIIVPLVLALMSKYGLKPPTSPVIPPVDVPPATPVATATVELPKAVTDHVLPPGFSGTATDQLMLMMNDMWNRMKVLEDREDTWQKERAEIIAQNKMLLKTNTTLGKGLYAFFTWIDEGANPPPPDISDEVRDIVHLIVEKVDLDNLK